MSEEDNREQQQQFSNAKELFKHNQQKIIERKESYYDKLINSMHLTKTKLDILIAVLVVIIILIFVLAPKQ